MKSVTKFHNKYQKIAIYIYIKKRIAENPMVNVLLATRVGT
jgi:hypothetical protein